MIGASFADRTFLSPNHGERLGGGPIDHLVLHYTGMRSDPGARGWLCDPRSQVSSHYVVFEDGQVFQLVDEGRRAWHAGRSWWRGVSDINSRSIGIEIGNPGHEFGYRPFPAAQIETVIALCQDIAMRQPIRPHLVVAHSDIAPERKDDPGELFPWRQMSEAGIGLWVAEACGPAGPVDDAGVADFVAQCSKIGFAEPASDGARAALVRAFQRHWRPSQVDGVIDGGTLATAERVAALFESRSEGD